MAVNASNLARKPDETHRAGDTELLRRYVADGSEGAFAELVSRHVGLVYAAALRQVAGSAHRAEDVAQTVFVALARQAAPLSRRTEIVGWLYTSTHHVAAKLKRTEQRRAQREQEAHAMKGINADDRAAADWDRLRPVLDAAMHGLSDADHEAILLRYFQNRRLAEIGQRLGLSEDAARMRVERALDKLQALLGRHGITSTTTAVGVTLANPALAVAPAGMAATLTSAALASVAVGAGAGGNGDGSNSYERKNHPDHRRRRGGDRFLGLQIQHATPRTRGRRRHARRVADDAAACGCGGPADRGATERTGSGPRGEVGARFKPTLAGALAHTPAPAVTMPANRSEEGFFRWVR